MFGTKKALFLELVGAAFDRSSDGMSRAAQGARERAGGDSEGPRSCADAAGPYVDTVADTTGLDPVTVKLFLSLLKVKPRDGGHHLICQEGAPWDR
jgi:hypothetical protein